MRKILPLLLLLAACRSDPKPSTRPAPDPSPPEDPRLEADVPHPEAERARLYSSSGLVPVMPTSESVTKLIAMARSVKDGGVTEKQVGDFALTEHAATGKTGATVLLIARGPEWWQISIDIDGKPMKGFVPEFMVQRNPYEAPLDVPIAELLSEYKANELRADGRWKGKLIRAHGIVGQVGKSIGGGDPFVALGTGEQIEIPRVQCLLADPSDPEALGLSTGSKATVQGRVERLMMNVIVRDCVVNPIAHLCRRLKAATGALSCTKNDATGDANGIIFDGSAKGTDGSIGALDCEPDDPKMNGQARARGMVRLWIEEKKQDAIVARDAPCLIVLSTVGKPKPPFPAPIRAKVQAFFDAL